MNKVVDGTLIDSLVEPGSDWWAEGLVLKSDALGWYVCHPMPHGLVSAAPKSRIEDIFAIRMTDAEVIESFAKGMWRVRSVQGPETDEDLRARLKKCPLHNLPYMPKEEWEAAVDAASGKDLEKLAADAYGVLRIGVPENYRPWGRPAVKS